MTKRQTNKGIKIIVDSIFNDIVRQLKDLQIDDSIINQLTSDGAVTTDKKKRNAPKIPLQGQCHSMCKSGKKCQVAICNKDLKKCWAHMSAVERAEYKAIKDAKLIRD
jgi:hypothetical protein